MKQEINPPCICSILGLEEIQHGDIFLGKIDSHTSQRELSCNTFIFLFLSASMYNRMHMVKDALRSPTSLLAVFIREGP